MRAKLHKWRISEEIYRAVSGSYDGICLACGAITESGSVEPDARRYECETCGERAVYGMEEALIMGGVEFGDEAEFDGERKSIPARRENPAPVKLMQVPSADGRRLVWMIADPRLIPGRVGGLHVVSIEGAPDERAAFWVWENANINSTRYTFTYDELHRSATTGETVTDKGRRW